jgi:hypothetical protein
MMMLAGFTQQGGISFTIGAFYAYITLRTEKDRNHRTFPKPVGQLDADATTSTGSFLE